MGELVAALPWPNVRGKRCLGLAPAVGPDLAAALAERGATVVDTAGEGPAYDVVVAWGVLDGAPNAVAAASHLHHVTRGVLVSCEPLDLWLSVAARGRPLFTLGGGPDGVPLGFNGAGHRRLLELGGFAIERVSKPFTVSEGDERGGLRARADALALRAITGRPGGGRLHRAVLARPTTRVVDGG